jgi:uncharacterized protein
VSFRVAAGVGLAAGLLGGLFGVGGGLIIVPALIAVAKMERRLAHGTSLAATLPIAAASLITYLAHGNVDWPVVAFLTIGSMAGAILGTNLLRTISKRLLTIIFISTVLLTAVRLFTTGDVDGRSALTVASALMLVAIGFVAGVLAGLLGIGGGVIMGPAMVVAMGIVPVVAKGTSAAVIVPTALMGTFRNRKHSNAELRTAAIVGCFGALSAVVGGIISDTLNDRTANVMFAVLLVAVAVNQLLTLRSPAAPTARADDPVATDEPVAER